MKPKARLKEIVDYIDTLTSYYTTALSEEKVDYNITFVKGKLEVLRDIRKRINKLDQEENKVV